MDNSSLNAKHSEHAHSSTQSHHSSLNTQTSSNDSRSFIQRIYEDKYKALMWITIVLLFLAIAQIGYQYASTGDFVKRDVQLKGGVAVTIPVDKIDIQIFANELKSLSPKAEVDIRELRSTPPQNIIEVSDVNEEQVVKLLESKNIKHSDYIIESTTGVLGRSFFRATLSALLISFIIMATITFITFRVPSPSLAVILAAFSDIVCTLAVFNLLGEKLTLASIAAFLMLIGYSVDTDILLSTRVLKQKEGTVMSRIYSSVKTGLMTTGTTIAAVFVGFLLAKSDTIRQIMLIILIGCIFDILNTWIQNVGIIRWYLEKRGVKSHGN